MSEVRDTLETVVGKINALWRKSDDHQVTIAMLIAEAKQRVEAGDPFAEGMKWPEFAEWHFTNKLGLPRPLRETNRLARIGASPDPAAAMQAHRDAGAERMRRSRVSRDTREVEAADQPAAPPTLAAVQEAIRNFSTNDFAEFKRWFHEFSGGSAITVEPCTASKAPPARPQIPTEKSVPKSTPPVEQPRTDRSELTATFLTMPAEVQPVVYKWFMHGRIKGESWPDATPETFAVMWGAASTAERKRFTAETMNWRPAA
jgi:hypothetical protein